MNHFLITDQNRHSEYEYYDLVLVSTVMSEQEMDNDHNDWQEHFLGWQFGNAHEDEDGDYLSDNRIVSVYSIGIVPKKDVPVLDRYLGTSDLDQIINRGVT